MQRLVKRLKSLGSTDVAAERERLESQLEALKNADYERLATSALSNKLKKDKVLSRNPVFQDVLAAELPVADSRSFITTAELDARLQSSKALSSGIHAIVSTLRSIVLPPQTRSVDDDGSSEKKLKPSGQELQNKTSTQSKETPTAQKKPELSDHNATQLNKQTPLPEDWDSGTVSESGSDDDGADEDTNSEENEDGESKPGPSRIALKLPPPPQDAISKPADSVFLPSLMVGFTRGDTDSDYSDREADVADGVRKNRRGQRARRAIWEKKYGKHAKHLNRVTQEEVSYRRPDRTSGHRAPTSQITSGDAFKHKPQFRPRPLHINSATAPMAQPTYSRQTQSEKPLHPSWLAKKRLKELQSANIRPAKGTRIKFDE